MLPRFALGLLAGVLLVPSIQAQSSVKPRTDSLGDLLPDGAIARLGTLRFKHTPAIDPTLEAVIFSPDGKKIASFVRAGVRLWDAVSGKEIAGPWAKTNHSAIAFSPDSKMLAAATDTRSRPVPGAAPPVKGAVQREIILYDIARAKPVKILAGQQPPVLALTFADGGKTLVAAGNGVVTWWDIASAKEQRSWKPFNDKKTVEEKSTKTKTFSTCAFSPDGKFLAVQVSYRIIEGRDAMGVPQKADNKQQDQETIGFNLATNTMNWHTTGKGSIRFAFSGNSQRIAIAFGVIRVEVRDAVTGKLIAAPLDAKIVGTGFVGGLALSADGSLAAFAGGNSNIVVWNPEDAARPRKFVARIAQFWGNSTECLHFSPDNKTLLVGVDADLQLYDVGTLHEVRPSEGHRGWIDFLTFSTDGKRLLTGSADENLHSQELAAWDVNTWKRLQLTSLRTPPWPNLGIAAPDQSVYVGKAGDDRFGLFDLANGKLLTRFSVPSKQSAQARGYFSPNGTFYMLASKDDNNKDIERLYAVPSGKLLCQLPPVAVTQASMESARTIAFSQDNQLVALFPRDKRQIHVIETATGKLRYQVGKAIEDDEGFNAPDGGRFVAHLAFSNDGTLLASWTSAENVIHIWDMATGKQRLQVVPDEQGGTKEIIMAMRRPSPQRIRFAWSPDGRVLAVGENKIRLWELATLSVRRELSGHSTGSVRVLAFSPDGRVLASGSADTTVLIWDMSMSGNTGAMLATLERGDLEKHWQTLAANDAAKAFAAICDLAAAPKEVVAWIKDKLKPAALIEAKHIDELITQLENDQYKVRQKATAELLQIGERVAPTIEKVLAGNPPLETRLRLQGLRTKVTGLALQGDRLQAFRAVEVLERISTPEARQVLQALAAGAPGALLTTQARGALERLTKS